MPYYIRLMNIPVLDLTARNSQATSDGTSIKNKKHVSKKRKISTTSDGTGTGTGNKSASNGHTSTLRAQTGPTTAKPGVSQVASSIQDHMAVDQSTSRGSTSSTSAGSNSRLDLRFKLSITTDLGEGFYAGDLRVRVALFSRALLSSSSITISSEDRREKDKMIMVGELGCVQWKNGMRVLSGCVSLEMDVPKIEMREYWVSFDVDGDSDGGDKHTHRNGKVGEYAMTRLCATSMAEVVGVMAPIVDARNRESIVLRTGHRQHVLRRFGIPRGYGCAAEDNPLELHIHEEMGESIARHIWDAALALLAVCTDGCHSAEAPNANTDQTVLRDLLTPAIDRSHRRRTRLEILELGSGCGMVGLGLARVIPDAHFVLTDLPEAMDILEHNIVSADTDLGFAPCTTVESRVLDWNVALTKSNEAEDMDGAEVSLLRPDLILVSDCTYNPSSFDALIAMLVLVTKQAHQQHTSEERLELDVLVSYKVRHASESQFFEKMHNAGFEVLVRHEITFPDHSRTNLGLDLEKAQIFAFRYRDQELNEK